MSRRSGGGAGRVIAGTARGTALRAPGAGTRPLADRVKQTLFAILEPRIRGRPFLDLYAGSGAGGIEALSRGASRAVFVEEDAVAARVIKSNLDAARFEAPRAEVVCRSVAIWLASAGASTATSEPFAAILVDPPYDAPAELDRALAGIAAGHRDAILADDGQVIAKHFWKTPPRPTPLLRSVRTERFGETMLTFYCWADEEDG